MGGHDLSDEDIIKVENLTKYFPTALGTVKAVDGVNFSVKKGETFGIVGESGSGKSTTGYVIMGLYAPTSGVIDFKGHRLTTGLRKRPKLVKKDIQMVFQDPGSSLNPKKNIKAIIEMPLRVHGFPKEAREKRLIELLQMVELPEEYLERFPREIGGGERQMVSIARALATNPSFIVLDEPTSALDVSMQAKILKMLIRFQKELDLSYIFITHNLGVERNVAQRIAIMYLGKMWELASASEFFINPMHPYTKMLLSAIPTITKEEEELKPKRVKPIGEISGAVNIPSGCSFHPRCVSRMDICSKEDPGWCEIQKGHFVRCHLYDT